MREATAKKRPGRKPTLSVVQNEPIATCEDQEAQQTPRKLYFLDGDSHVCGRLAEPLYFEPTYADPRPFAMVLPHVGEYLMELEPGRYEWGEE